jgi:dihydroflavonol-4-reductase
MKALVTGANGFLASNVVRELNRRGFEVRAMVRPSANLLSLSGTVSEVFQGYITESRDVMKAVKGCDVVIHAAADTSQHHRGIGPYWQVNVAATLHMLEASFSNKVKKFIFVSTANTFGYGTKDCPGNEDMPAKYPFSLSGYAISKMQAQDLVLGFAQDGRLNATVVNPTFMIGAYDSKPSSGRIITRMYQKKFVLVPPGGKNFVHVADVANGICSAIAKGKSGSCYLLAHENLTYGEFFKKIDEVSGQSRHRISLSPGFLAAMGITGEVFNQIIGRSDLNRLNAKMLCVGNYYSSAKALKELDLPQTPINTAIADAINWFGSNGYFDRKWVKQPIHE